MNKINKWFKEHFSPGGISVIYLDPQYYPHRFIDFNDGNITFRIDLFLEEYDALKKKLECRDE